MTLRAWLKRERQRDHSGINARQTLKALVRSQSASAATFGLAVAARSPDIKRLLFASARNIKAAGL